jgi:hypothetical protein
MHHEGFEPGRQCWQLDPQLVQISLLSYCEVLRWLPAEFLVN